MLVNDPFRFQVEIASEHVPDWSIDQSDRAMEAHQELVRFFCKKDQFNEAVNEEASVIIELTVGCVQPTWREKRPTILKQPS